ncbi:hypothetical protein OESDEN_01398 [Oesophagostomum dentatum]|uniref:Uncharacterized protein n=1 Tax=Oesophagostomum dentatum TaxID=61180 RepID=A0A0B1TN29_OESDE|nr:hypothetical protein OESDEN_01398 [Oesophagostomum dentatum]
MATSTIGDAIEKKVEKSMPKAFLSTDDQVIFYEHCGYHKCEPILHSTTATSVFPVLSKLGEKPQTSNGGSETKLSVVKEETSMKPLEFPHAMAPPPPPPPLCLKASPIKAPVAPVSTVGHQYMCKKLI